MKTKKILLTTLILLLALCSCTALFKREKFRIGIDPTFSSLELDGLGANLRGFCNELFVALGEEEGMDITFVKTSWDILESGLKKGEYEAMISGRPGYLLYENTYDYSDLFLATGPILVLSRDLKATDLSELNNRLIATIANSKTTLLLDHYPNITMRPYSSIPLALNAVESGDVDGALIPNLFAQNYVHNLYPHTLKIVGEPLTEAGLRLFTLHDKNERLLALCDRGLEKLRKSGKLHEMMVRWQLTYTLPKKAH